MDISEMTYAEIIRRADNLAASGKTGEAIELLRQGMEKATSSKEEAYVLCFQAEIACYEEENIEKAFDLYQQALEREPENLLFLANAGIILTYLGRDEEAIELYDKALAIEPDDVDSLQMKGVSLSELGREEEAIELYDKALAIEPDDVGSLQMKGVSLSELGREEEAIKFYDKALEIEPDDVDSLRNKGISLSKLGREEEAIKLYDKALEIEPEDVHSLRHKGASLDELGREEEAIKLYDKALEIEPDDMDSLRLKGVSLSKLGRMEETMDLYDKALEIEPEDVDSLRMKGVSLSKLGREEEAIKLYDKALEIEPDDVGSLRQKGVSLSELGREEEAIKLYDKALAIEPDDADSHCFKAASLAELGHMKEAIDSIDRAIKIDPNDANSWGWKSKILEDAGDFDASLNAIKKCKDLDNRKEIQKYIEYRISFLEKKLADLDRVGEKKAVETEDEIFARVIEVFRDDKGRILKTISENEEKLREFTSENRSIPRDDSFSLFSILRKWNSYTPILPSERGDNRGGGYFLHICGRNGEDARGIVIDPGFNFVENFYEEGFKAADIDAILISHAHNDHTVDLESILTLVKEINENIKEKTGKKGEKKIDLFLNLGTFLKYSGWLNIGKSDVINEVKVLHAGNTYDLSDDYNGLLIHALRAAHDEIIDNKYCLGFILEVDECKIALTGDTGWKVDNSIADQYADHDIDLMIAHLGSIKQIEFDYIKKNTPEEKQECLYPQHLGILGVGAMLSRIKPKLAVISEFGEEMKPLRKEVASKFDRVLTETKCIPGDVGLHIKISDLSIYSMVQRDFIPFEKIKVYGPQNDSDLRYYQDAENESDREEIFKEALDLVQKEKAVSIFERIKRGPVTIR